MKNNYSTQFRFIFLSFLFIISLNNNLRAQLSAANYSLTNYSTSGRSDRFAIADVNNDTYPDIVATSFSSPAASIAVMLNDGSGAFSNITPLTTVYSTGTSQPSDIAIGDIDNDGDLDIVVAHTGGSALKLFNGDGTGNFVLSGSIAGYTGNVPTRVQLADMNNDGKLDIITTHSSGNALRVQLQNGGGGFSGVFQSQITGLQSAGAIGIGDINGDGNLDVVTGIASPTELRAYLGNGAGVLSFLSNHALTGFPQEIRLADMDNDGFMDIVADMFGASNVAVFFGASGPSFGPRTDVVTNTADIRGVAVDDFDGDGNLDIVTARYSSSPIYVSIMLGDGVRGFASGILINSQSANQTIHTADFNQDGVSDIAVSRLNSTNVGVFLYQDNSYYSIASGDWNVGSTWSTTSGGSSCGCTPSAGSNVIIEGGFVVTQTANNQLDGKNITLGTSIGEGTLDLQSFTNGIVTTLTTNATNASEAGSIRLSAGNNLTVTNNTFSSNTFAIIDYYGTTFSIVNLFAGSSYPNLIITSGSKTLIGNTIINQKLLIRNTADLQVSTSSIQVNGVSTVEIGGSFLDNSTTGSNLFIGSVDNSGYWGGVSTNQSPTTFGADVINNPNATFSMNSSSPVYLTGTNAIIRNNSTNTMNLGGTGRLFVNANTIMTGTGVIMAASGIGDTHIDTGITLTNTNTNELLISAFEPIAATSSFINDVNAVLRYTAQRQPMTNAANNITGNFDASASGNKMIYALSSTGITQNVRSTTYEHLNIELNGSDAKVLQGNITVTGDLLITSATLNTNNFDINIKGNWINKGAFTEGTSTVTFSAAVPQTIEGATNFYNLTLNNATNITLRDANPSPVVLATPVLVSNILTLTNGNIILNDNDLTVMATVAGTPNLSSHVVTNANGAFVRPVPSVRGFAIGGGVSAFTPVTITADVADLGLVAIKARPIGTNPDIPIGTPDALEHIIDVKTTNSNATTVAIAWGGDSYITTNNPMTNPQVHYNAGSGEINQPVHLSNGVNTATSTSISLIGGTVYAFGVFTPPTNKFITTWETTAANEIITIPTYPGETYNYSIDWGDGSPIDNITTDTPPSHNYVNPGIQTISIDGVFPRIYFNNTGDKDKIRTIEKWGDIAWSSMESAFDGCTGLTTISSSAGSPDLTSTPVTNLRRMFMRCTSFVGDPNMNNWNVSTVTLMEDLFTQAIVFNQNISNWNVSNVTSMGSMFTQAAAFNNGEAAGASTSPLNWTTTSLVNDGIANMFSNASSFNQDISSWNVSGITSLSGTFIGASLFNQDLSNWERNTPTVSTVANVTSMVDLFNGTAFNQDISNWNVSNVTDMRGMFRTASAFNQDLSNWERTSPDISTLANVKDMSDMFLGASLFNQSLGNWNISGVEHNPPTYSSMQGMLAASGMSPANYDATLIGWAGQSVQPNVQLGAGGRIYCAAIAARNILTSSPNNWVITGDAVNVSCLASQPIGNRSLYFDGVDDYVQVPDNPDFEYVQGTVEFWVKPQYNFTSNRQFLVGLQDATNTRWAFYIEGDRNDVGFFNGSSYGTLSYSFNQNQWYHLAFVDDGSSSTQVFVNGSSIGTIPLVSGAALNLPLRMGMGNDLSAVAFEGQLDELRIYSAMRTQAEIQSSMSNNTINGAEAYWSFDTSTAQLAIDVNGNDGILGSSAVVDANDPLWALRVTNTLDDGSVGSLRWAISEANTDSDKDYIDFSIQQNDANLVSVVSLGTDLSPISESLLIDGYSAFGSLANTQAFPNPVDTKLRVTIDGGDNTTNTALLPITGGNVTIQGLCINNYSYSGSMLSGKAAISLNGINSFIQGCFIGTDYDGLSVNIGTGSCYGITAFGGDNLIGGANPEDRNVLTGFGSGSAINSFYAPSTSTLTVQGNFIGTFADKSEPITKNSRALEFVVSSAGSLNYIGGNGSTEGNLIAYNTGGGSGAITSLYFGTPTPSLRILAGGNYNNIVYCNTTSFISNFPPPSYTASVAPPVITAVSLTQATGTSLPNVYVDVYVDNSSCINAAIPAQGQVYKGTVLADGAGNWTLSTPFSLGDNVTAIQSTADNTSDFSVAYPFLGTYYSRKTGNWTDATVGNGTWSTVGLGGESCDCIPPTTADVVIGNGHEVTVTNNAQLSNVNLEIRDASTLNLGETNGHTINTLSATGSTGQRIKFVHTTNNSIASIPLITTNNFTNVSGSVIEFGGTASPYMIPNTFNGDAYSNIEITGNGNRLLNSGATTQINGNLSNLSSSSGLQASNIVEFTNVAMPHVISSISGLFLTFYDDVLINGDVSTNASGIFSFQGALKINAGATFTNNTNDMRIEGVNGTITGAGNYVNALNSLLICSSPQLITIPATNTDFHSVFNTVLYQSGASNVKIDEYYRLMFRGSNNTVETAGTITTFDLTIDQANSAFNLVDNSIVNVTNDLRLIGNPSLLDFGVGNATVTINGNLIASLTNATIRHNASSGKTQRLELKGASNELFLFDNITILGSSDVIYSGTNQNVFASNSYQNLEIAGGGIKDLQGVSLVNNTLTLTDGLLRLNGFDLTYTGTEANLIHSSLSWIETNGISKFIRTSTGVATFPIGSDVSKQALTLYNTNNPSSVRFGNPTIAVSSVGSWFVDNGATSSPLIFYPQGTGLSSNSKIFENVAGAWTLEPTTFISPTYSTTNPVAFSSTTKQFAIINDYAEINVQGNSNDIVNGSTTPSTINDTDFGNVIECNINSIVKTFTIQNIGTIDLAISGVSITGTHATDFTLGSIPTLVSPGSNETFTVTFDPSAVGTRFATITITNDDLDEASYSFDISGVGDADNIPPTLSSSPTTQTVSTNSGCTFDNSSATISDVNATDNCSTVTYSYDLTGVTTATSLSTLSGVVFNLGTTIVSWTVTDGSSNSITGSFNVVVEDNEIPTITAIANQTVSPNQGCTFANNVGNNNYIADGTAVDNCSIDLIEYELTGSTIASVTTLIGQVFNEGLTTITWRAKDATGNFSTSSVFTISVIDNNQPPVLIPMQSFTKNADQNNCYYTNRTTANNTAIPNGFATDNCGVASYRYILSGATVRDVASLQGVGFNVGVTTVTWTAADRNGNVSTTNEFTVTVKDNQVPVFVEIEDLITTATSFGCMIDSASIILPMPIVTDNCLFRLTNDAPAQFGIGETLVTWTAIDSAGNTSTAEQHVTIYEIQEIAPADSLILVQMYQQLGGDNWRIVWDLDEPVRSWHGVELECGYVKQINLIGNNLTGTLPLSVLNFERINDPDFSINISSNRLGFESAEDFVDQIPNFTYAPQSKIYQTQEESILQGSSISLTSETAGDFNLYQWYKDGQALPNQVNPTLNLTSVVLTDAGEYTCLVRNTRATQLTLERNPILLNVEGFPTPTDSLALIRIFEDNDGENWVSSWTLENPVATWEGVTLKGAKIVELDLSSQNLKGRLPEVFDDEFFSELRYLSFFDNQLEGSVPASLGAITTLVYLDLDKNKFEGALPTSFGDLINLQTLWLSRNKLTSIPNEIGNLASLRNLYLNDNQISELPESIGLLQNLITLSVSKNMLSSLPNSITNLRNLNYLEANQNKLVELPQTWTSLINLTQLDLNTNQLSMLPISLLELQSLNTLRIAENELEFDDLLPFANNDFAAFEYAPQAMVGTEEERILQRNSSTTLNAQTSGDGNAYQWFRDGQLVGSTLNLQLNRLTNLDVGSYTAKITNAALPELTLERRPIYINVECVSVNGVSINEPQVSTYCEGQTFGVQLAISTTITPIEHVRWRKNDVILAFANGQNYVVTQAGIYTAEVQTTDGCTFRSNPIEIKTVPTPIVEIELVNDSLLVSTIEASEELIYQWRKDGEAILDAINPTYRPKEAGEYTLEVLSQVGCSSISSGIIFTPDPTTGIDEPEQLRELRLYPNPNNGSFYINFGSNYPNGKPKLSLIDALGRKIDVQTIQQDAFTYQIKTTRLAGGVYTLQIQTDDGIVHRRFIIEE